MRMIAKTTIALGFAGAMAVAAPSPTLGQGVYFQGPGVEFGIGRPAYRERYYRYDDEPRAYSGRTYRYYDPPARYERRYHRRGWDWD
jgi:hypothetical protein